MEKRGNSKGKSWRWPVFIGLFLALGGKGSLTPDVCIVVSKRSLLFPNFNSRNRYLRCSPSYRCNSQAIKAHWKKTEVFHLAWVKGSICMQNVKRFAITQLNYNRMNSRPIIFLLMNSVWLSTGYFVQGGFQRLVSCLQAQSTLLH